MQMRAGGPTGRADPADELTLPDCIPHPHCVIGTVQECAVQAHAMVQNQATKDAANFQKLFDQLDAAAFQYRDITQDEILSEFLI